MRFADAVAHDIPQLLDRIEFGAGGRQREHPDVGWELGGAIAVVEAGTIIDHHMEALGVVRGDLLQERTVPFQAHGFGVEELRAPLRPTSRAP